MLSSHFYESRDGSTGGFFADNVQAGQQVWNTVNLLLRLDGIGRYRGPCKVIRLCGERTNNGMNELFALARKRMIWSL
jgi:hypothetical protein